VYLSPMDLDLRVQIDQKCRGPVEGAVAFETGATAEDVANPSLLVYEHRANQGALSWFFEDLILGRAFPLTLAMRNVHEIDAVLAAALFLRRDLALHPSMPGLVASCDLLHRHGLAVMGHLESDLGRFLRLVRAYLTEGLNAQEAGTRLVTVVDWFQDFVLTGRLPHLGRPWPIVHVLDKGSNGFVVAELATGTSLRECWVELYRQGFLRGVLIATQANQRRGVLASKKSKYLDLDLGKASVILNEMERAMGLDASWQLEGDLWLHGPKAGTAIRLEHLLEIFLRV
jgi:hypothetical protein